MLPKLRGQTVKSTSSHHRIIIHYTAGITFCIQCISTKRNETRTRHVPSLPTDFSTSLWVSQHNVCRAAVQARGDRWGTVTPKDRRSWHTQFWDLLELLTTRQLVLCLNHCQQKVLNPEILHWAFSSSVFKETHWSCQSAVYSHSVSLGGYNNLLWESTVKKGCLQPPLKETLTNVSMLF